MAFFSLWQQETCTHVVEDVVTVGEVLENFMDISGGKKFYFFSLSTRHLHVM